jgi:hypothetical protein
MIASLCLLGCILAPGQLPQRPLPALPAPTAYPMGRSGMWVLSPQLNRAQELVYRGQFREEANSSRVQFNRIYRLDLRVFVLEAGPQGYETAFLSVLKTHDRPSGVGPTHSAPDNPAASARLEVMRLDMQGQLTPEQNVSLNAPLEGAPTIECGLFVPAPKEHMAVEQEWQALETNRPPRTWRIVGAEMVNGASCLKLIGNQQSDDWDRPRADRTAWKRQDTVWMIARQGYASRVERVIELREPARRETTQRSILRYDLESSLSYPGPFYERRREEISQARGFAESAAPLLAAPQKYGPQLNFLIGKINTHLENEGQTPYRDVVLQVRRRLEAAQRGETPLAAAPSLIEDRPTIAAVGQPAPDFVTSQFTSHDATHLRMHLGRPVLLVFYNPASETADALLTYAQNLSTSLGDQVAVLPMCVSDDPQPALNQRALLKLTLPILSGSGLRISYGIDTTPKMILLDGSGIVRGAYLGWGRETATEIGDELKTWLAVPAAKRTGP